jgi:iron uptake system component EfeO
VTTEPPRPERYPTTGLAAYHATPGYDQTGYVEYSQVLDTQRTQRSGAVNGLLESLSGMSGKVGRAGE